MNTAKIDQQYEALQVAFGDIAKTIQTLAQQLQDAAKTGDSRATEWLLELKQVALAVRSEQTQVNDLLATIHGVVEDGARQTSEALRQQADALRSERQSASGLFGGSSFGQAVETGMAIGLGETLIDDLFR